MIKDNYGLVIEHIQLKAHELSVLGSASSDMQHGEFYVETKFRVRDGNRNILVKFQSSKAEGTIGIWFESNSMDVLVWETKGGEALYQISDIVSDWNQVTLHIDDAVDAFINA